MNSQPVEHILLCFRNTPFPVRCVRRLREGDPVVAAVFVEEDVVVEFAGAEEFDPVVEVGVCLFVSGSGDSIVLGLCCTQYSSQEVISRGSGLMRKAGETCLGKRCRMCRKGSVRTAVVA